MRAVVGLVLLTACAPPGPPEADDSDVASTDSASVDTERPSAVDSDPRVDSDVPIDSDPPDSDAPSDPFADHVVRFDPGPTAGFGQDRLPGVVLGPPDGRGPLQGGLDVLSLGNGGSIVLGFDLPGFTDGDGVDLIVFENAFPGWSETGSVAVSADGTTWYAFPCDPTAEGAPGCAGTHAVLASRTNGVDPTDPAVAGGDPYDLADVGVPDGFVGRFVRVTDTGANALGGIGYAGTTGGFDLDAIAVVRR